MSDAFLGDGSAGSGDPLVGRLFDKHWGLFRFRRHLEVIPVNDVVPHEFNDDCVCKPYSVIFDDDGGTLEPMVNVHFALDEAGQGLWSYDRFKKYGSGVK